MGKNLVATSSVTINVPVTTVWDALTNPAVIKQYMFGTEVVSDWQEGHPIIWKGVWNDKPYEDKGVILKIVPNSTLQLTHFSSLSGVPDVPENYHTLTYKLAAAGTGTHIVLSQDNNATEEEQKHSQQMWDVMLASVKKLLEN